MGYYPYDDGDDSNMATETATDEMNDQGQENSKHIYMNFQSNEALQAANQSFH